MTQLQAMVAAFASYTGWVAVDAAIKWGSEAALSPYAIMAVLGLVGAFGIFIHAASRGTIADLRPINIRAQAFLCLCSLLINYGNVIALKHLPLTLYYILVLTAPMVVAVLVSVFKHETLSLTKIACLLAGFAGVVVALAPRNIAGLAASGEWIGYAAAFLATSSFAAYAVVVRQISDTDKATGIQFVNSLAVGIAGLIGCVGATLPAFQSLAVMAVAALVNIFFNVVYAIALKHTAATNVAQLHYTQIITGAIVGFLIWHEHPTPSLVAGSVLIVASGLIVAHQINTEQR